MGATFGASDPTSFLEGGGVLLSIIREVVPTVRDTMSDFVRMVREGSQTLMRLREKKEQGCMRKIFWELGGFGWGIR